MFIAWQGTVGFAKVGCDVGLCDRVVGVLVGTEVGTAKGIAVGL